MNNKGEIKIADFGLSIDYSASSGRLFKPVTTLLYRAPEQVFGVKSGYDMQSDVWSLGCIFAELLTCEPLFCAAKNFSNFVELLFARFSKENFDSWPEVQESEVFQEHKTKLVKDINIKNYLKTRKQNLDPHALDLLSKLLTLNPANRIRCSEVLEHHYFTSEPLPCEKDDIPKIELECHEYTIRKAYLKKKLAIQARLNEKQAVLDESSADVQIGFGGSNMQKGDMRVNMYKRNMEDRSHPGELKRLKLN